MSINQLNSVAAYKKSLLLNSCAKTKIDKKRADLVESNIFLLQISYQANNIENPVIGCFPKHPLDVFQGLLAGIMVRR